MSIVTTISDAVVSRINAAELSVELTAVRGYRPVRDLAGLSSIKVAVIPVSLPRLDITDREGSTERDYQVDIIIQKQVAADQATDDVDLDAADALMDLEDEIINLFPGDPFSDGEYVCTGIDCEIFDMERMNDNGEFFGVISLTVTTIQD